MLHRIVRMVFDKDTKAQFTDIFYQKQPFIQAMDGCISVDLMNDERDEMAMATYSLWESEQYLEAYRHSELFIETWKEVKPLFSEKAKAWSYTKHVADENH